MKKSKQKVLPTSPRKSNNGFSKISANTNTDNRLNHASIMLNYMFDWGVDFQRRVISLTGDIDDTMYEKLNAALTEMEAESKSTVTVKIKSLGGDVYSAMAIVGRLKESTCHIVTKGYGCIMSSATLILASGNRRKISEYSWFMFHESSYEPGWNKHSTHKALIKQQEREEEIWAKWMSEFSEKSENYWLKIGSGNDFYITPSQALKLGVIDEIF